VCVTQITFAQDWVKIWSDEFDYTGLPNTTKWTYDVGGNGWGNNELQYYTDARSENARVENGKLIIEARKEAYQGNQYTSARLVTKGLGDWKYGKIEVRAKIPTGNGMWPAIWMLPSENVYGTWPKSGEIDIMENVGFEPNTIHWNVHTESYNHSIGTNKGDKADFTAPYNNYYTYAVEWYEDSIRFLVDGVEYFKFDKESNNSNVWPFDQKFHLLLNIAVGGWGGVQGIDANAFPQKMYVDYVRVYKQSGYESSYTCNVNEWSHGTVTKTPDLSVYDSGANVALQAIPDNGYVFNKWYGTVQGVSSSLNLTMYSDYYQTPEFLRPNEQVVNSQFLGGIVNWGGYGANMNVEFGVHKTNLSVSTPNPWDVQMSQDGIALESGKAYTLTVVASASQNKMINVALGKASAPWTSYVGENINLTTTSQTFVIQGVMGLTNPDARVVLNLGGDAGDVFLEEISVVEDVVSSSQYFEIKESITIYPNPFTDNFIVASSEEWSRLSVYNVLGGLVYDDVNYQNNKPLDLSLQTGIYYVKLKMVRGDKIVKVVKK
jgi:beta-glucanase (GH16 family)